MYYLNFLTSNIKIHNISSLLKVEIYMYFLSQSEMGLKEEMYVSI